jgi:hypothetical protein
LRGAWYVAHKADGGTTMQVYRTKRVALKAAAVLLRERTAEVVVGPMLDTRECILSGEELRRVVGQVDAL